MRSPFSSEREAFRSLLLLIVSLIPIVLAAALGPTWLAVAVLVVVLCAMAARAAHMRMRELEGLELPVKMAPPHVGGAGERRILVVANDTLSEPALLSEVGRLASVPGAHLLLLAPAVVSSGARLTGSFDGVLDQARDRMRAALDHIGREGIVAGEISEVEPLAAVEDAFATFAPDEVIVCTRSRHDGDGLAPELAALVRERFAVPVRHLVCEPGSEVREPDQDTEARYRQQSGKAAARNFGFKSLAAAGIIAAVAMSLVALVRSSEKATARQASEASAQLIAGLPPVAREVTLKVIAEGKLGPEGEKHDEFTTTEFSVRAGQPQYLRIDNTDEQPHSITAPEAGVNIIAMPGTHTYRLLVNKTGRFLWFCTYRCDEWAMEHVGYMSGYITVS